jgi:hypothetical protein
VFSQTLVEFLFRLTFGVAAAMAVTPAPWVTSGFFRVHLWVLLGVQTLTALAVYSTHYASAQFITAFLAATVCYVGSVIWMYESRAAGKVAVVLVAALALAGTLLPLFPFTTFELHLHALDRLSSGLLLGLVTTSMLLGHWYLNTPTMRLEPLKRLIVLLGLAVVLRMIVGGAGAWLEFTEHLPQTAIPFTTWALFLTLRWLAGLVGVLVLAALTWQTLKIPNTQSATGILYAAVILAFIGELTSQLLSAQSRYPV